MEALPYLKDLISTNIPVTVTISKRVGQYPETDFNTKQPTGRMQTLYNFTMPDGKTVRHYAKEREEDTLKMFSAGEEIQVVRQESNKNGKLIHFLVWTPTEGAEARLAANPPVMSNTRETATQREMKDRDEEREQKDIQICLQGFAQAYIIQGKNGEEALKLAEEDRARLIKRSGEIRIGVGPLSHSPAQVQVVNEIFGADQSAPLPDSPEDYRE